ncbi:MAG: hypothetical protein PW844_18530 [Pantoea sp.]|nr:HipA family kinase [Pantoea sp.]MDE1188452.1 hypothetical protein [Pantoea sp.]
MLLDVKDNRYYLIDHNLAFDQNATLRDFNEHVFSHLTRSWEIDMVDQLAHREKLLKTYSKMPHFWEKVPESWLSEDQFETIIDTTLNRASGDDFWSSII